MLFSNNVERSPLIFHYRTILPAHHALLKAEWCHSYLLSIVTTSRLLLKLSSWIFICSFTYYRPMIICFLHLSKLLCSDVSSIIISYIYRNNMSISTHFVLVIFLYSCIKEIPVTASQMLVLCSELNPKICSPLVKLNIYVMLLDNNYDIQPLISDYQTILLANDPLLKVHSLNTILILPFHSLRKSSH